MTDVKIYEIQSRPLPSRLTQADEFETLNDTQQANFAARLRQIEEIPLKACEWLTGEEADFKAFIDRIELDLHIVTSGSLSRPDTQVSTWLIHSSWTFETNARKMRKALSGAILLEIDRPQPTLDCAIGTFNEWLKQQTSGLTVALDDFFAADSLDSVMAHQLAIDALLTNLLAGISKVRLNDVLSTWD